jgi:predicted acyl esterase
MLLFFGANMGHSGIAPRNIASAMIKGLPKAELDRRTQEAKSNPDLRNYSYIYSILTNPERNPLFFDYLLNPTDGPFYWERSPCRKVDRIQIPVYCGVGLGATQLYILSSTFDIYLGIKGPKKLLLTGTSNPDRPFHQWHDEFIRWYDYWLKGIDNGVMNEPPIKRFVSGANQWCYEKEWPFARTEWTKFYLRSNGRISTEPETIDDLTPNSFVQEPLTVTTEIKSLKYVTPPLIKDTEIAGPIALYLYASIDTDDTNWIVTLNDVNTDGSRATLSRGHLKASHRAIDEGRSKPWRPYHPHTKSEPVVPGQVYEYAIEIQPISHVFKAGHRIGLEMVSMDAPPPLGYHYLFHVGSSKVTLHKIYCDRKRPSHLLMPVIPKT